MEGVNFRFEEVRSIVYTLSDGKQKICREIPLLTNYRSHSGVLDCAALVLDYLFTVFPGAARVINRDTGLYRGPRPVYMLSNGLEDIASALRMNERLVVLCHDESVEVLVKEFRSVYGVKNTIIGIRASKGLEFSDVLILNFFGDTSVADQTAWKRLLALGLTSQGSASKNSCGGYRQLETQLKVLYTAITRCCNRLMFAECGRSTTMCDFYRLLKTKNLAEPLLLSSIARVDSSSTTTATAAAAVLMTSDEWRARGIEFIIAADGGEASTALITQAISCFESAGDKDLKTLASATLDLHSAEEALEATEKHGFSAKLEIDFSSLILHSLRLSISLDRLYLLCKKVVNYSNCDPSLLDKEIVERMKSLKV